MKRGDQHPVSVSTMHGGPSEPEIDQPEQTGIVVSSEKEEPVPEQSKKPSMGALPVDTPGSNKRKSGWHKTGDDEWHESTDTNDEGSKTKIIATGADPDPEHAKE